MTNPYSGAQIIDMAVTMLVEGVSFFVRKNDFTPSKINAKQGGYFSRNEFLADQLVHLCWTSSKGFRIGVVFYGDEDGFPLSETFSTDINTYIASFNLSGLVAALRKTGEADLSQNTLAQVLVEPNDFSSWLFWPQYPSISYSPQTDISETHYLNDAYEQWFQQYAHSTKAMHQPLSDNVHTIKVKYLGTQTTKNTNELIYRFSVQNFGKSAHYHLIAYDAEFYLLDYVYDSVPLDMPMHDEILAACKAKISSRS